MKRSPGSKSTCMGKPFRPDLEKEALNEIIDKSENYPRIKNNNATDQSTNLSDFPKAITFITNL